MPWISNFGSDMQSACGEIPGSSQGDAGYSTPDVYGRAVQLYLALERAAQDKDFKCQEVLLWRGLLTILALRNFLDLPLVWENVSITPSMDDPLSNALGYPPKSNNQLLYPDNEMYQWDGETFYTLSWAPKGQDPIELAIYSPMTLIYPVADWRETYGRIPQLRKFFDARTRSFLDHDKCLQGGELDFVYPWLRDVRQHLMKNSEVNSNARRNIVLHLDRYMRELSARDGSLTSKELTLKSEKFGYTQRLAGLVPTLVTSYGIGGPVFSDQLCVLRVDKKYGNPFITCEYSKNYEIKGSIETDVNLYAFLPVHPGRRAECRENGLVENISMTLKTEPGSGKNAYIHVTTSTTELPGISLEKDYLLADDILNEDNSDEPEKDETPEKNLAVYYKNEYNRNFILNKDIWPLFSVWPTTLDANWNQYYVMRSSENDCLRICGEYDAQTSESDLGDMSVEKGDSKVVVKTPYVPDSIPLIRMLRDREGRVMSQGVTIGMITPQRSISVRSVGSAIVAVDFGTSSTRVFYTLVGDEKNVEEIYVVRDTPLEVTQYANSIDRQKEMSTYFISPTNANGDDETLYSIFRRSEAKNRDTVRPLLDGAIYQPSGNVTPESTQYLVTDLKWNNAIARPYYVAFMQQLCLHIMTYLYQKYQISSIEWRYALPKVMDELKQNSINSIWKNEILTFLNKVSASSLNPITHTIPTPPTEDNPRPQHPLLTESIAASRYFDAYYSTSVSPRKGYLVIDIGGGSTDVALWQRGDEDPNIALKWHSSVHVAGRRMFTRWMEDSIEDMTAGISDPGTISLVDTIKTGDFSKHQDPGAREALVDRLLTANSKDILASYTANIDTQPDQWGGILLNKLTQAVSLLLFSLGYQVGSLMRVRRFSSPPGPDGDFTIAFGGRGSNVLKWLKCGTTVLTRFFMDGVAAAGEMWPDVHIKILTHNDLKCEVARGLLVKTGVGAPTGWETVSNGECMDDIYYYADSYAPDETGRAKRTKTGAATAFYESFLKNLPRDSYHMVNMAENRTLGTAAGRAIGRNAYVDDVFRVLLESIFSALEESNGGGVQQ